MISQFLYNKASESTGDKSNTSAESTKTEVDTLGASPLDNIGKQPASAE
jgi:phospholipid/cholesterol/gamma-HCH transport system substrate-binding protein